MAEEWSDWLDFDRPHVEAAPESPGVFVMHASMKVLYIGGGPSIRAGLIERLWDECTGKAKRFKYMLSESPEGAAQALLKDFAEKHQGKLPLCNDN
jgi:hypothetical protein